MKFLSGFPRTVFQDIETYLRTEIDLIGDHIRLVLDKYNSSFITYELYPGIYFFKDQSAALFNILQLDYLSSNSGYVIEVDDITLKTNLFVKFGIIAI